jgi:hypothetical protein
MILLLLFLLTLSACNSSPNQTLEVDVLVIGAGTGGTAAAIQSARMGANTLLVEPTAWPGGMLTAAGVSAIDGNHEMPAGIWGEFRTALRKYYGSPEALQTGWVTHTAFEPKVGKQILEGFIEDEKENLTFMRHTFWKKINKEGDYWKVILSQNKTFIEVQAKILIDGTDLGDVLEAAGATFDLGMESRSQTGEEIALESGNDVIQDLTYTAILKDYGPQSDNTIDQPTGYDPNVFDCACLEFCSEPKKGIHPCQTMMTYAKLPNDKYLINWPLKGNDIYLNIIGMDEEQRIEALKQAKLKTLNFVYFIQHQLGYKNLGLADDEFPSNDLLPLIPYHREGRRLHGLVRFNLNHVLNPYEAEMPLYKTGIAVGDYPIDHHHKERADIPDLNFPSVPSFGVPLGALIPKEIDGLIIADKAISVSNIVNGSTRLQPVILQIGQAAGALAALSLREKLPIAKVPVRLVQNELLNAGAYLVPSYDVDPNHPHFKAIQKIASTGLLLGKGEPYAWANRTWYYPDAEMQVAELKNGLKELGLDQKEINDFSKVDLKVAVLIANKMSPQQISYEDALEVLKKENFIPTQSTQLSRGEFAKVIDLLAKPFESIPINHQGLWIH